MISFIKYFVVINFSNSLWHVSTRLSRQPIKFPVDLFSRRNRKIDLESPKCQQSKWPWLLSHDNWYRLVQIFGMSEQNSCFTPPFCWQELRMGLRGNHGVIIAHWQTMKGRFYRFINCDLENLPYSPLLSLGLSLLKVNILYIFLSLMGYPVPYHTYIRLR